jgi:SAM-dependent methyltransferase
MVNEQTLDPTLLQRILRFAKKILPILRIARGASRLSRRLDSITHKFQFLVEWGIDNPEYFDHFIEQHFMWRKDRHAVCWERGVMSSLALDVQSTVEKPKVLELCCGDGFNTYHFYSIKASHITAVDFDESAIKFARKRNAAPNVSYQVVDIRKGVPGGSFNNVIWDAAIEHFTEQETDDILVSLKGVLVSGGILSGYTLLEKGFGKLHLHQHEREFVSKEDLAQVLLKHFRNVQVIQTTSPERENLYFFATDGILPLLGQKTLTFTN